MIEILKQAPALQIIIPLFAALISALTFNKLYAWLIATFSSLVCLIISVYCFISMNDGLTYNFGGWEAPIGIEYRIDLINQPIIIFLNAILLFFLLFGQELISKTISPYTDEKKQHIFYTLLLFAHLGYIGVISSNDLFNIYVFIEISSLTTYVLMSMGKNPRALVGAFDYLMLGTIGATLILIGIGFLLSLTGSLNISDIAEILKQQSPSRVATTAIVFFLCGAILKMAFFPMHFWMIRAYSSASPIMLTYLASISSLLGVYLILRFIHFTIDENLIYESFVSILRPASMLTILICTILALKSDTLKKVVIYSTSSQIGYIFLLISIWPAREILFQFLFLDAINKLTLFTIIAHIQHKTDDLKFESFKYIENSGLFKALASLAIIFSAGLPISSMFIIKVKIFDLLISHKLYTEFAVVIIGSIVGFLYHLKFIKAIFFSPRNNGTIKINTKLYGLTILVILQIITIISVKDIASLAEQTESVIIDNKQN